MARMGKWEVGCFSLSDGYIGIPFSHATDQLSKTQDGNMQVVSIDKPEASDIYLANLPASYEYGLDSHNHIVLYIGLFVFINHRLYSHHLVHSLIN